MGAWLPDAIPEKGAYSQRLLPSGGVAVAVKPPSEIALEQYVPDKSLEGALGVCAEIERENARSG